MKQYRIRQKRLKQHNPRKEEKVDIPNKPMSPEYKLAKRLRSSDRWKRVRNHAMSLAEGMCLYCYNEPAEETHHIKGVTQHPELCFELGNLCPLGIKCHGFIGVRNRRGDDTERQIRDKMERNIGVRSLEELNQIKENKE